MHIVTYTGTFDSTPLQKFLKAQSNVTYSICESKK